MPLPLELGGPLTLLAVGRTWPPLTVEGRPTRSRPRARPPRSVAFFRHSSPVPSSPFRICPVELSWTSAVSFRRLTMSFANLPDRVGSLVFCPDCGNLLATPGDHDTVACELCGRVEDAKGANENRQGPSGCGN